MNICEEISRAWCHQSKRNSLQLKSLAFSFCCRCHCCCYAIFFVFSSSWGCNQHHFPLSMWCLWLFCFNLLLYLVKSLGLCECGICFLFFFFFVLSFGISSHCITCEWSTYLPTNRPNDNKSNESNGCYCFRDWAKKRSERDEKRDSRKR